MKKRLVVLISGSGSNLQALIDACNSKALNAEIVAVFSNKADAYGLLRAQQAGITKRLLFPAFPPDRNLHRKMLFILKIPAL